MLSVVERISKRIAAAFGYRLEKLPVTGLQKWIPPGAKLHVGCGEQDLPSYLGCDLRPLAHVHWVCKAWEVSQYCGNLSEIYSRHMLEHLTRAEAQLTLQDWHRALAPDGLLRIEVPNMAFHIAQWLRAKWDEENLAVNFSDTRWGFAGFYGWQRECDPRSADYNCTYWDVHKSGYTPQSMQYFLNEAGFQEITIRLEGFSEEQRQRLNLAVHAADECHLVAVARKAPAIKRLAA